MKKEKKLKNIEVKSWLLIIITLAFISRVLFVLGTQNIGGPGAMDSQTYQSIAMNLIKGHGFSEDGINPSIFVAPLYPFALAAIYKIFGPYPLIVEIFQCLLGIGTAILVFLITRKFFSSDIALVAMAIVAFIPELFVLSTFLYTESLFIFLLMATLFAYQCSLEHSGLGPIAFVGILAGFMTLARPTTLLIPGIIFLTLLVKFRISGAFKRTLIFSIFFVLPIIPWTVRNYTVYQEIIPVTVGNGDNLWTGNYLPFDGKYNYEKTRAMMDSMSVGLNQKERNDFFVREAKKNLSAEPLQTAWLMVRKIYRFWFWVYESIPSGQKRQGVTFIQVILKVVYYPLLVLFILGILQTRSRWRDLVLFYLFILYYLGIHVLTLVVPRYRFPILPIMAIFAAYSLYWLWQHLLRNGAQISNGKMA